MKNKQIKRYGKLKCLLGIIFVIAMLLGTYQLSYASWVDDDNGTHYKDEDGNFVTGFQEIDNELFYFSQTGNLLKGKFYVEAEDAYYYADDKGRILTSVIKDESHFYITDDKGRLKTGFVDYNRQRYYFNSAGEVEKGWFKADEDWYYADDSGCIMVGFITVDGYRYYLGEGGKRVSNTVMEIDGTTYVFNEDGSVNENATSLYPWISYMNQQRKKAKLPELKINTKVQACAILRAADLVNGYDLSTQSQSLKKMLGDRGVSTSGGYEFSYGGVNGYTMEQLLEDIKKDTQFLQVLREDAVTDVGVGVYEEDGISYYDVVFIKQ